jgi:hypothetical protein
VKNARGQKGLLKKLPHYFMTEVCLNGSLDGTLTVDSLQKSDYFFIGHLPEIIIISPDSIQFFRI